MANDKSISSKSDWELLPSMERSVPDNKYAYILDLAKLAKSELLSSSDQNEDDEQIPILTKDELIQKVRKFERAAGYTLDEYKDAIDRGEIKNYSRAMLNIWQSYVDLLKKMKLEEVHE